MTNRAFIDELSRRLRDDNPDKDIRQWDEGFLTEALNAAFGALCHVKPESFVECRDLTLAEGHEQQIDDDLHQIVEILHNVCPTTGKAKRAITKADRSVFDATVPHWRQDEPRSYVRHFMRNDILDAKFDVWPPAPAARPLPAPTLPVEPIGPELPVFDITNIFMEDPDTPPVYDPGVENFIDYNMPVRTLTENGAGNFQQDYTLSILGDAIPLQGIPHAGFIADFSQIDFDPIIANRGRNWIVGIKNDGVNGSGETLRQNIIFEDQSLGETSTSVGTFPIGAIQDHVLAGRPYVVILFRQGFPSIASDFVSSPDDIAPFYAVPETVLAAPNSLTSVNNGVSGQYYEYTTSADFDFMTSAPLYSHFTMAQTGTAFGQQQVLDGNDVFIRATNPTNGEVLEWNIDFINGSQPSYTWLDNINDRRFIGGLVRLDKVSQPGDRGLITILDSDINSINSEFNYLPLAVLELAAQSPTQEEVDAFDALHQQYLDELRAFNEYQALPEPIVIRGTFTKTPCIGGGTVVEVPVRGAEPFVPDRPIDPGESLVVLNENIVNRIPANGTIAGQSEGETFLGGTAHWTLQLEADSPLLEDDGEVFTRPFELEFDIVWPGTPSNLGRPITEPALFTGTFTSVGQTTDAALAFSIRNLDGDFVAWNELIEGVTYRISKIAGESDWLILPLFDTPTQQELDDFDALRQQYLVDLQRYQEALQALAEWTVLAPDYVATPPGNAPVFPGELGFGSDIAPGGVFTADSVDWGAFDRITLMVPSGDSRIGVNQATLGTAAIVDIEWPDVLTAPNGRYDPASPPVLNGIIQAQGNPTGSGSNQVALRVNTDNDILSDDARLSTGSFVRVDFSSTSFATYVGTDLYDPGVTQEDLDLHAEALIAHEFDVLLYQTFLRVQQTLADAAAQSSAGLLTLDDPFPFDKAYTNPISEYALYYAYAVDDDVTANSARAQRHWLAFFQLLNKREDSDLKIMKYQDETE